MFGLYKGVVAPFAGFTTINSIVFGIHGNMMQYLEPKKSMRFPTIWKSAVAGGIAGGVQCVICSPMELLRIRMQVEGIGEMTKATLYQPSQSRVYHNTLECLIKTYQEGGVRGVYKGMVPTLWREIPSFAAYFATWEYLCQAMSDNKDGLKHNMKMYKLLIAGGFSGISAWVVSYPFDVVKTRIQIDGVIRKEYDGMIDCFVKTYRNEGLRAFVKGLGPALVRAFPANAATFAAMTVTMKYLKGY